MKHVLQESFHKKFNITALAKENLEIPESIFTIVKDKNISEKEREAEQRKKWKIFNGIFDVKSQKIMESMLKRLEERFKYLG
jgi:hypothetical protein